MKKTAELTFLLIIFVMAAGCKSTPSDTDSSEKVRDIFAGTASAFILRGDNTLWGAGYNRSGQLGLGQATPGEILQGGTQGDGTGPSSEEPQIACINNDTGTPFTGIKSVVAGENHTVILKDDGTVWGAGDSSDGELGQDGGQLLVFTQLKADGNPLSGVKAVAAGNNSTFYISGDDSLWTAGYNYYGELGLGNRDKQSSFKKVESAGQNVKTLAAGIRHTALLKEDGTLWTAGYNYNGQLGLGAGASGDPEDQNSFTEVKSVGSGITAVAAGNYHTVILKSDGSVWGAGSNYWGQLGFPDTDNRLTFTQLNDEKGNPLTGVKEIAARGDITVILRSDGSLLLAGNYSESQAVYEQDTDAEENDAKQNDVKSKFVSLAPDKGSASSFGTVKKIVLGNKSVYVIDSNDRLWAAGSNRYGQLHLGFDTESSSTLKPINP